ncbi:MAG: response regulator transcription factor [Burkholderiales bacterium]|jgi:DNA-binding response OmpR family regulator
MPRRILIVDDQAEIRRMVRYALQDGDFTLYEAANGELAMRIAAVARPELVVLDQMMPGTLDGIQVCQQMKADPRFADALILMLTGNAEATDRQAALAAGVNYFLTKPFAAAKLRDIVEMMLQSHSPPAVQ